MTSNTASRWYYAQQDQAVGPLSFAEIEALSKSGQLAADTLIVLEGSEDWQPLSAVIGARPSIPPPFPSQASGKATLSQDEAKPTKESWLEHPAFVIACMVFCFPVGLFFLWKSRRFNLSVRVGLAAAVSVLLMLLAFAEKSAKSRPSETEFGLTTNAAKLRLIKPGSWLFTDEKALADYDSHKNDTTGLKVERLIWSHQAFPVPLYKRAEMLEENGPHGMSRVRIYAVRLQKNFDMWISPDALAPFDLQTEKQATAENEVKNAGKLKQFDELAKLRGKIARVTRETFLFADNDALWQFLEEGADDKPANIERLTTWQKENKLMLVQPEMNIEGTIVSTDGPLNSWLLILPKGATGSNRYWVKQTDVETRDAPPSPGTVEKLLHDKFKKRLLKFEASEITSLRDKFNLEVRLAADPGLSDGSTKRAVERDMVEAYRIIYTSGFPAHEAWVFVSMPLTDKYGKTADEIVYKTSLTADEAGKVNWAAPYAVNFADIWQTHFTLPQWEKGGQ